MRRFAISDIHGCVLSFEALLDKIAFSSADELYLLGDFVDRGRDSKGVIDLIWKLQQTGHQVHCLRGNHDQMLLDGLDNMEALYNWLRSGGEITMQSFGANFLEEIPSPYLDFLRNLPYYLEIPGEYILVHAGLDFREPNPLEHHVPMMWIRPWQMNLDKEWLAGRVVVHGHTPTSREEIETHLQLLDDRPIIDIDAGCVFPRLGHLCALDLTNRKLHFQENVD